MIVFGGNESIAWVSKSLFEKSMFYDDGDSRMGGKKECVAVFMLSP
jgi:hypothetical protein